MAIRTVRKRAGRRSKKTVRPSAKERYNDRHDQDDRVFKALANGDRRAILDFIRDRPRSTKSICEKLAHLDRCTVMLHLRVLEGAELVIVRRDGRIRYNYLNIAPVQRIYQRWIRDYAQPAAEFLTVLKRQLES